MGIFDGIQQQQQPQGGGVFAGLGQAPAAPAAPGGMPQGGQSSLPPQLLQMIQQAKQAEPQVKQQFIQHVMQQLQSSGKPPEMVQQAVQEFMGAMQQ